MIHGNIDWEHYVWKFQQYSTLTHLEAKDENFFYRKDSTLKIKRFKFWII